MANDVRALFESFNMAQPLHKTVNKIKQATIINKSDLVLDKIITEFLYHLWNSDYVKLDDYYETNNGYMVSYTILDRNREKYVILILNNNTIILDTSDGLISARKEDNHFKIVTEEVYNNSRYTRKKEPF